MTAHELYSKITNPYYTRSLNSNQQKVLKDIIKKLEQNERQFDVSTLSRISLSGNYDRKLIRQLFSTLNLKVTKYTYEYGKNVIYF